MILWYDYFMARTTTKKTTTKKPAARKAAAKSTTRTTKKTVSKPISKATSKSIVTSSNHSADYYQQQTRLIQKVSVPLFLLLAVAAATLMNAHTSVFALGYMVRDQIASQLAGSNVFAPAARTLWEVQTKWLLVTLLVVSALFSLLMLTRARARFEQGVKNGVQPLRWFELGITSFLIIELVALLSGINNVVTLKLMGGLLIATCGFSWLAERQNQNAKAPVRSAYGLSVFTGVMPWIVLAVTAVSTLLYGMIRAPWYVYALYAVTLAGFTAIGLNQLQQLRQRTAWKNTGYVERNYALIGVVTKLLIAVVLIAGLQK